MNKMRKIKKNEMVLKSDREKFTANQQILQKTRERLKKEFVGLDSIIDEIVKQVSPWFLFPEFIEKPYIINLWGMTGVGKTAVINRLVELIGCSDGFVSFDLGLPKITNTIGTSELETIAERKRKIIFLDEFQHIRSFDLDGSSFNQSQKSMIWKLIDSGKFRFFDYDNRTYEIKNLQELLKALIKRGVRAQNGLVTRGSELFKKEIDRVYRFRQDELKNEKLPFVPESQLYLLINASSRMELLSKPGGKSQPLFYLEDDLRNFLKKLNEQETIEFLGNIIEKLNKQREIVLSNLLIIIAGNLDEAYEMATDFNNEIDADEFYRQSSKVGILTVKEALKRQIRLEEIARLGNNYILFPSISKESYRKIIDFKLEEISATFYRIKNIKLKFQKSIKEFLFSEGVIPAQGIRPLLSTIDRHIKANLSKVYSEIFTHRNKIDLISLGCKNGSLIAHYQLGKKLQFITELVLTGEKVRKEKEISQELQAVIAVHESGHAIASTILKKRIPQIIFSASCLPETIGYTRYDRNDNDLLNSKRVMETIVTLLAGLAAEKVIFGKSLQTIGSKHDIAKATELLKEVFESCGIGKEKGAFSSDNRREKMLHNNHKIESVIKRMLKKAFIVAINLLEKEKKLLTRSALYLAENSSITGKKFFENYFKKYATAESIEDFNKETFSYYNHLKSLASKAQ